MESARTGAPVKRRRSIVLKQKPGMNEHCCVIIWPFPEQEVVSLLKDVKVDAVWAFSLLLFLTNIHFGGG